MSDPIDIGGHVAPGFEGVRDTFARNFAEGLETGSAFSAWRRGELLVDLWGGEASPGRPWHRDSLQLVYSGSKGLTAICMLMLLDRGRIALDRPVADYWPAFGKRDILVRQILSHTSRLPGIGEPTSWEDMLDDHVMARKLEAQQPFDDPRAVLTYHPVTYGWLCGELLRQVDGRSLGRFFAEEIARPLELEIWFGVPESEEHRVTVVSGAAGWAQSNKNLIDPTPQLRAVDPLQTAIWYNPPLFGTDFGKWNARALHASGMPGAAAIGTPRSIARLYDIIANGGGPLMRPETVALGRQPLAEGFDVLNGEPRRFAVGFSLQVDTQQYGPRPDGFGHGGAGGSVHGAWPSDGVGFSYAMNRLTESDDQRAARLLAALALSIG